MLFRVVFGVICMSIGISLVGLPGWDRVPDVSPIDCSIWVWGVILSVGTSVTSPQTALHTRLNFQNLELLIEIVHFIEVET